MLPNVPAYVHPFPESSVAPSAGWRLCIPTYLYAVVFASCCVLWGLTWDIMWLISSSRDGLFAPPHVLIYVGAIVSGLFSAYQILRLTLHKNHPDRTKAVEFWGVFYESLGAMSSIWGALAMLTSAPFDDWWHNTYGPNVRILTPPHTILLVGIMTVQFGAIVGVLALQNQYRQRAAAQTHYDQRRASLLSWLLTISASLLVAMLFLMVSSPMSEGKSHHASYYIDGAVVFPVYLLAMGRASLLRWPITTIAGQYLLVMGLPNWIIQYFPATPRLGPVLNPVTHYQPFHFPLLLVIPGLAVDWLMHQFDSPDAGITNIANGLVPLCMPASLWLFYYYQWCSGHSARFYKRLPSPETDFFLAYSCGYDSSPDEPYRHTFASWHLQSAADFWIGVGKSLIYATLSTRIGLAWGNWMKRVER